LLLNFSLLKGGDAYGGVNLMAEAGQSFSEDWLNFFNFKKENFYASTKS